MNERQALRLERMADHPRSVGFPAYHPEMTSLLGVPIQLGEHLFGMLYLCDRFDGLPFTEEDQWLVETLAGYAALAIAGVLLSDQRGRLVLLEERERVGNELHDGIIQSLYAIGMQLQLIRLSNAAPDAPLDDIIHSLDTVIEDIRRYILNLRVADYERQTVHDALEDVVARLHVPSHLTVDLDVPQRQSPFPAPVLEAVCQIAQEALSNAIRHADASTIRITATETESLFQLAIEDNGRGFDTDAEREGLGLRNIQQRARIHGGKVTIRSALNEGTRLTLTIPLNAY
jgi:signal transduction histidine kinase